MGQPLSPYCPVVLIARRPAGTSFTSATEQLLLRRTPIPLRARVRARHGCAASADCATQLVGARRSLGFQGAGGRHEEPSQDASEPQAAIDAASSSRFATIGVADHALLVRIALYD